MYRFVKISCHSILNEAFVCDHTISIPVLFCVSLFLLLPTSVNMLKWLIFTIKCLFVCMRVLFYAVEIHCFFLSFQSFLLLLAICSQHGCHFIRKNRKKIYPIETNINSYLLFSFSSLNSSWIMTVYKLEFHDQYSIRIQFVASSFYRFPFQNSLQQHMGVLCVLVFAYFNFQIKMALLCLNGIFKRLWHFDLIEDMVAPFNHSFHLLIRTTQRLIGWWFVCYM